MADPYGFFYGTSSGGRSRRDGDLTEEDVWGVITERRDTSPKVRKSKESSSIFSPRRLPSASKMIPRPKNSSQEYKVFQQSAPVNIPDWSKIYRKDSKKGYESNGYKGDLWVNDDDYVNGNDDDEEEEDDDDDSKVPPHEWLAKKLARSQISSFSVCEGIGRTLKGRDISKVRNAVLSRTGFLE